MQLGQDEILASIELLGRKVLRRGAAPPRLERFLLWLPRR
jgi:hypothetical protein